jgi:hypothetical protein
MKVWKDAFKAAHPQSPVQADNGKRFKDRDIKTVGRLAYEREFDRILRDAWAPMPRKWRDCLSEPPTSKMYLLSCYRLHMPNSH